MTHEQLLKDLVAIKSYSGEEEKIRGYISNWFDERKIPVLRQGDNLVVQLNGKDRKKAFIMNSHMDTVSAGDTPWKYGAWTPTMEGKKLVGLGTSDMKGGIATSMLLCEKMFEDGAPVNMYFTYVVNEEIDGSGTESFANWFKSQGYVEHYKDIAGIFTEATGMIEIEHGHRGNLFVKVEAEGPSGHSSRPGEVKGTLAVRKLISFVDKLQESVKSWNKQFPNKYFDPAITLGEFTSLYAGVKVVGDEIKSASANKFPSIAHATVDLRTTAEFHGVAYQKLQELAGEMDVKVSMLYPDAPAGFTDPSEKIVKVTQKLVGPKGYLTVSQGSADLGFLSVHGVKAIIFGPGDREQNHKTDEYTYPAQIPQAVKIYEQILKAWAK